MDAEPPTQAAILTPIGHGGIAVVHLAGPRAHDLARELFRPRHAVAARPDSRRILYGHIVADGEIIDEVLVRFVPAAASPDGQPRVEVNCHGGIVAVQRVLECLVARGAEAVDGQAFLARRARTRLEAEAASALLEAATPLAADTLLDQLDGALGNALAAMPWRQPDAAARRLSDLLATERLGRALWQPPAVAIVGPRNAGKSTLFNALAREDRMIVSPVPGTTRDAVRAEVALGGLPVWLADTAGQCEAGSPIEQQAIEQARETTAAAAFALLVLDGSGPPPPQLSGLEDALPAPCLLILNKSDLGLADWARQLPGRLAISAVSGEGLDALATRLVAELVGEARYEHARPIVFTDRQGALIRAALERLDAGHTEAARALIAACIGGS